MTERMDNVPRVGLARLRRAMENQMALGGGEFHLPFSDVEVILREAEEERGVLSSIPQNVGAEPEHYRGDGVVTCSRALRSMFEGWERAGYRVSGLAKYWAGVAFKYIWRFP